MQPTATVIREGPSGVELRTRLSAVHYENVPDDHALRQIAFLHRLRA